MDLFKYTYHSWPGALTDKICQEIIDYGLSLKKEQGVILGNKKD